MPLHSQMQRLKADIQKKRILRRLDGAQVPHQLGGCLCNVCAFAKLLRIHNSMICLVRRGKSREFIRICVPVKVAAVYDRSADAGCMAIHVLGGRVGYDIRSPFERPAVDRRCKCIVYDKRNPMGMGCFCKLFKVQHDQCRICNGLSEYRLGILSKRVVQFFFRAVWIHKGSVNAHLLNRMGIEIICTAIKGRRAHDMIASLHDIHNGIEACRLSR